MKLTDKINRYIFGKNRLTRNLYTEYIKNILVKLKDDEVGVICDYNLGETYLFCSMLNCFKKTNNISKVVMISDKKYHRDIFEMFDDRIARWYIRPGLQKRPFWNFRQVKAGGLFYIHDRNDWNVQTLAEHGLTFLQALKLTSALGSDAAIRHPENNPALQAMAKALFKSLNLVPNKTVFMAPQAGSIQDLDGQLCRKLCDELRRQGYDIFLNDTGYAHPVEGVKSAFLPLKIAAPFCDLCGFVIALRSGLCEVISSSRAQFHILYPDQTYRNVFTLKEMLASENIIEYSLNESSSYVLVQTIINNMQSRCIQTGLC